MPAEDAVDNPDPDYSTAYAAIVGENDDLINMIAYCLYKKQKREFFVGNRLPFGDTLVRRYHDDLNGERIETLRGAAKVRLQNYAKLIQQTVREEESNAIRTGVTISTVSSLIENKHREIISTLKKETVWWKAVLHAVIGGFALGLIIIAASRMGFMNPFEALPSRT